MPALVYLIVKKNVPRQINRPKNEKFSSFKISFLSENTLTKLFLSLRNNIATITIPEKNNLLAIIQTGSIFDIFSKYSPNTPDNPQHVAPSKVKTIPFFIVLCPIVTLLMIK